MGVTTPTTYRPHDINGQWSPASSTDILPVHDSSTEAVMATVPASTVAQAHTAVLAACAAFEG